MKHILIIILLLTISATAKAQGRRLSLDRIILRTGYTIHNNVVYYKWRPTTSIAAKHSKKNFRAWKKWQERNKTPIPLADAKTFKIFDQRYGADSKSVFYFSDIIEGADPNTFTQIEHSNDYYKDKNNVYRNGKALKGADAATFRCLIDTDYAFDKNNIYCWGKSLDVDPEEYTFLGDYLIGSNKVYYLGSLCENINIDSFRLLEDGYATDGNIIIYYGKPVDADIPTFRKFLNSEGTGISYDGQIYTDKNRLYERGKPIEGSGTNSRILKKNHFISNNNVFCLGVIIPGADAGSFVSLSEYWGKDNQMVYYHTVPVEDVGVDNMILGKYHLINNGKVFYGTDIISGADAGSFTSLSEYWGKDKQTVYYEHRPLKEADPNTFKLVDKLRFGFDENYFFDEKGICMRIDGNSFRYCGNDIFVDNKYAYVLFVRHPYKIRVDGKTFEEVGQNGDRVVYKDKNHTYEYVNDKLKKVRN